MLALKNLLSDFAQVRRQPSQRKKVHVRTIEHKKPRLAFLLRFSYAGEALALNRHISPKYPESALLLIKNGS